MRPLLGKPAIPAHVRRTPTTLRTSVFPCGQTLDRVERQFVLRLLPLVLWSQRSLSHDHRLVTWPPSHNALPADEVNL